MVKIPNLTIMSAILLMMIFTQAYTNKQTHSDISHCEFYTQQDVSTIYNKILGRSKNESEKLHVLILTSNFFPKLGCSNVYDKMFDNFMPDRDVLQVSCFCQNENKDAITEILMIKDGQIVDQGKTQNMSEFMNQYKLSKQSLNTMNTCN